MAGVRWEEHAEAGAVSFSCSLGFVAASLRVQGSGVAATQTKESGSPLSSTALDSVCRQVELHAALVLHPAAARATAGSSLSIHPGRRSSSDGVGAAWPQLPYAVQRGMEIR